MFLLTGSTVAGCQKKFDTFFNSYNMLRAIPCESVRQSSQQKCNIITLFIPFLNEKKLKETY